ncbi:hypothetical protein BN1708_012079 [Verticillium longisporum]|uniref:FAD linked oxidase N-terminal domain-containing protein n=1 Tax=Verticillium longisporum TaxID=100787 RepID=A0A0G4L6Y4_VERLO|nr:hypothetical protein BN1708_012079 [Verticillium longisporum]
MDAKTAASHAATVQSIAAAVKTFHARRQPFRIHHGSTNSTRPAHGQPVVDISALNHVLHVDKAAKTVSVEPNVAMDGLLDAVLPHNLAFVRTNRDLEAKVRALGGRKVLYSHAYYDEDDFWAIYGRAWYDELRLKYHATTLPTVYDKVRVDIEKERAKKGLVDRLAVKWPFAGLIGVASALRS